MYKALHLLEYEAMFLPLGPMQTGPVKCGYFAGENKQGLLYYSIYLIKRLAWYSTRVDVLAAKHVVWHLQVFARESYKDFCVLSIAPKTLLSF